MMRMVLVSVVLAFSAPHPQPGMTVATCDKFEASDHEKNEGYFICGKFSISVPPNGVPADMLREHLGKPIEIIIRVQEPRVLRTIQRLNAHDTHKN
jgi:hypothetical protein